MSRDARGLMFRKEVLVVVHESGDVSVVFVEPELKVRFTSEPIREEISGGLVDSSGVLSELPVYLDAVEGEGFVSPRHHSQ